MFHVWVSLFNPSHLPNSVESSDKTKFMHIRSSFHRIFLSEFIAEEKKQNVRPFELQCNLLTKILVQGQKIHFRLVWKDSRILWFLHTKKKNIKTMHAEYNYTTIKYHLCTPLVNICCSNLLLYFASYK